MESVIAVVALLVLLGVWSLLASLAELRRKAREYDRLKPRLETLDARAADLANRANMLEADKRRSQQEAEHQKARFEQEKQNWRTAFDTMVAEKCQGFPWLAEAYADFVHLQELKKADYLTYKKHRALKAAAQVRAVAAERRKAEKLMRVYRYLVQYYEDLFPWLEDFKGEDVEQLIEHIEHPQTQDEEHADRDATDPASKFLTKEEYARLSRCEKFQLALDRYWMKKKSRWEVGRDYERYIGYQYETAGFKVYYQGIVQGLNDLGRDLVCDDGEQVQIVQCKRWSEHKQIHEKHIFQLFGTVTAYRIDHPDRPVKGFFVTSTTLSQRARQFARELAITVVENMPLRRYPCVKCNVSRRTGEGIYHLPFDQQYDRTIIEAERDELYLDTVAEAEAMGFRRAFRWRGPREEGEA